MAALGTGNEVLDIRPAASLMLREIKHPFAQGEPVHDITFENVQAGLRTDFLFRIANMHQGMVIGTGDLSELALGWCTYGVGDQMAHYNVNAGLPKTLIQHIIRWAIASGHFSPDVTPLLSTILATEISPELVPVGENGPQSTEDIIGPYALHDFTLFYVLRYGFTPSRIAFMAEQVWQDASSGSWPPGFPEQDRMAYDLPTIRHWLHIFLRRFLAPASSNAPPCPTGQRSWRAAVSHRAGTGAPPPMAMRPCGLRNWNRMFQKADTLPAFRYKAPHHEHSTPRHPASRYQRNRYCRHS